MATGVVSWSQTAATNATADTNVNMAEGMAPSQLNDSVRALMTSVAKWRDDVAGTLLSSGSPTAITVATNQIFPSLTAMNGQTIAIRFSSTNGTAPTLSVDGLTAKPIQLDSTVAVNTGSLRANSIHHVTYDNAAGAFIVHHGHTLVEPGRIQPHGSATAPNGWLLCDGTGVSRTTYADLFAIISTVYGSSDGASFKVPDLRGKAGVGMDTGGTGPLGTVTVGTTTGAATHAITAAEVPAHTHPITDPQHTHNVNGVSNNGAQVQFSANAFLGTNGATIYSTNASNATNAIMNASAATGITVGASTGAGTAISIVQPSLIVNYVIKT